MPLEIVHWNQESFFYPSSFANKNYLARYQVCMVELARINGELEDVSDEEEGRDNNGNPKFDPSRLNRERQHRTPSEQWPPPEHANGTNTNGGANVGNRANGGATCMGDL
jgi:hypothetical protein